MPIILKKISDAYQNTFKTNKQEDKLYILLYKLLSRMIVTLELPENTVLPPSRKLASELQLSRSTVLRAYEMLIFDDLIASLKSSGYLVKCKSDANIYLNEAHNQETSQLSEIGKSFLKLSNFNVSNSRENLAFSPGLPPLDIFPVTQWKNLTNMYWKEVKFSNLSYSPSSGIEKLKVNIANYLTLTRNINCDPSQIMIVSGSLQSLYLIGTLLVNPGEAVYLENPTFPNVHAVFKGLLAQITGIPLDKSGIRIDSLKKAKSAAKIIHVTPSCHYPTGIKMTLERRLELLAFAEEKKSYLIENDYEHELNNWDNPIPALFSLDKNQRTLYIGTFNRILHPSLRIGYMLVPPQLKLPIEMILKHSHRFVAPSVQFVLSQFIEKKVMHTHLHNLIQVSKDRKQFFTQTFQELFINSGLCLEDSETLSLQSLIKIENNRGDKEIIQILNQHNLSAHSFSKCFINKTGEQGLIMGYCSIQKNIIKNKLLRIHEIISV